MNFADISKLPQSMQRQALADQARATVARERIMAQVTAQKRIYCHNPNPPQAIHLSEKQDPESFTADPAASLPYSAAKSPRNPVSGALAAIAEPWLPAKQLHAISPLEAPRFATVKEWSEHEVALLRAKYQIPDCIDLQIIATEIGRSPTAVAIKASKLGLTSPRGKHVRSESARKAISEAQKEVSRRPEIIAARSEATGEAWKTKGHPKGFTGKTHSPEHVARLTAMSTGRKRKASSIDAMLKTRLANHGHLAPKAGRAGSTWKQGWREIAGEKIFFRSRWEFNYALYLEMLRKNASLTKWEHEKETFWFEKIRRGCRSYLPDFRITHMDGKVEYHEVKGWMDARSKTKIKRMAKYYPHIKLRVIDGSWFKQNARNLKGMIPEWES